MHGLELSSDGQASFFTAREPAWHRLGTVTQGALSAEDALRTARLGGWDVVKRPVMTTAPDGSPVPVPDRFATVRRNPDPAGPPHQALGIVGKDYTVIQNEEAFAFLNKLARDDGAIFETAGSLHGGRQVFVTMRLPEPVHIAQDDELTLYVAVTTGHDGEVGFAALPTPVRVVCQNTLSLALRNNGRVERVRHDSRAAAEMAKAEQVLRHTISEGLAMRGAANKMLMRSVTNEEFDGLVARHFVPIPAGLPKGPRARRAAHRETLAWLYRHSDTQAVGRGTAWAAFNAVAEWSEWDRPRTPGAPSAARSVLLGQTAEIRRRAFAVFGPGDPALV